MTQKDWRKTKPLGWTNDKTLNKLRVFPINNRYDVLIYNKNWVLTDEYKFEDSVQALKFAKEYMEDN
jgi:hypothetical protein